MNTDTMVHSRDHLITSAREHLLQFSTSRSMADLTRSMTDADAAIRSSEASGDDWVDDMNFIIQLHWARYITLRESRDLDDGISKVDSILRSGNSVPWLCDSASELLLLRYSQGKAIADLELAVMITYRDHPKYITRLNMLANQYYLDFKAEGRLQDLDRALEIRNQVADIENIEPSLKAEILGNLGLMYCTKFKKTVKLDDIRKAIDHLEQAIQLQETSGNADPGVNTQLARALTLKYSMSRESEDITQACRQLDIAIGLIPQGDPLIPLRMNDKVAALQSRYFYEGGKQDLDEAWSIANGALGLIAPDSEDYPLFACNVGGIAQHQFNNSHDKVKLDQALEYIGRAVSSIKMTKDSCQQAEILSTESYALLSKYKCTGTIEYLDRAANANERALQLVGQNHDKAAEFIFFQSIVLHEKAESCGSQVLLQQGIQKAEESLQRLLPNSHSRYQNLFKLCSMNLALFRSKPEPKVIQAAILYGQECAAVPHKDSPQRREAHNVLSNAYFARFEVERGRADIDKAIEIGTLSIKNDQDPNQPEFLTNLASKLRSRAIRYDNVDDIDQSVTYIQKASSLRFPSARIKLFVLGSKSLILLDSYRLQKNLKDLLASIDAGKEALAMSKDENGSSADMLVHLGNAYYEMYIKSEEAKYRREAISYGQRAIESSPRDYYKKCMILERLGSWLHESYSKDNDPTDGQEAKAMFKQALEIETASPTFRIQAGRSAAGMYVNDKEWDAALRCLEETVSLFPQVSSRMLSREDQQFGLGRLTGLAAVGASCALNAGKTAGEALEILEAGRGIISGWRFMSRNEISNIERHSPDLANSYVKLRDEVLASSNAPSENSQSLMSSGTSSVLPDVAPESDHTEVYRNKVLKLLALEREIRERVDPRFQTPLTSQDFVALAQNGPIVELNITQIRSDAFLITESDVIAVPLPACGRDVMAERLEAVTGRDKITNGLSTTRKERNAKMRDLLAWLWDVVVEKVLNTLGIMNAKDLASQRIFWVTNGLAGLCPLHAAGHYDSPRADNCFKRAVSTYVTTLKALRTCREKDFDIMKPTSPTPLVIGMNKTAGNEVDLAASEEAQAVADGLGGDILTSLTFLPQPSKSAVLQALKGREIVHFACHGYADTSDPSKSRLLLHDSVKPGTPDFLTLYDLWAANEDNAQMAYLSACSTAENASIQLIDESVHMASAFQLIGFTHVIGTLWPVGDRAAVSVAASFYSQMAQEYRSKAGRKGSQGHAIVAHSLHEAVRQLRETKRSRINPVDDVLSWATFVHFGA